MASENLKLFSLTMETALIALGYELYPLLFDSGNIFNFLIERIFMVFLVRGVDWFQSTNKCCGIYRYFLQLITYKSSLCIFYQFKRLEAEWLSMQQTRSLRWNLFSSRIMLSRQFGMPLWRNIWHWLPHRDRRFIFGLFAMDMPSLGNNIFSADSTSSSR